MEGIMSMDWWKRIKRPELVAELGALDQSIPGFYFNNKWQIWLVDNEKLVQAKLGLSWVRFMLETEKGNHPGAWSDNVGAVVVTMQEYITRMDAFKAEEERILGDVERWPEGDSHE